LGEVVLRVVLVQNLLLVGSARVQVGSGALLLLAVVVYSVVAQLHSQLQVVVCSVSRMLPAHSVAWVVQQQVALEHNHRLLVACLVVLLLPQQVASVLLLLVASVLLLVASVLLRQQLVAPAHFQHIVRRQRSRRSRGSHHATINPSFSWMRLRRFKYAVTMSRW